jgi:alanine racemase
MTQDSTPYRCWVEISRPQLIENYRCLHNALEPGVEIAAVVKADAYRHGAVEVSRTLAAQGVRWFAVSSVEEGVNLREAGIDGGILIMAGVLPYEHEALFAYQLTPVLHSLEELRGVDEHARRTHRPIDYHLKIDTGLNRLGIADAVDDVLQALSLSSSYARLTGLMTHFASASDFSTRQTEQQIEVFENVRAALEATGRRPRYVHMAATNAIAFPRRSSWCSMVRPGHALYGYVSTAKGDAPQCVLTVKPVLTWKTRVLAVKDVAEGQLIGYGGMFRANRPMRIAVLSAGYADGIPHRLSNRGKVIAAGKLVSILGAVSRILVLDGAMGTMLQQVQTSPPPISAGRRSRAATSTW